MLLGIEATPLAIGWAVLERPDKLVACDCPPYRLGLSANMISIATFILGEIPECCLLAMRRVDAKREQEVREAIDAQWPGLEIVAVDPYPIRADALREVRELGSFCRWWVGARAGMMLYTYATKGGGLDASAA